MSKVVFLLVCVCFVGCGRLAPSLREPTVAPTVVAAEPEVQFDAMLNLVVRVGSEQLFLPEGWQILAEAKESLIVERRESTIAVNFCEDSFAELVDMSVEAGMPLSCSQDGNGCHLVLDEETLDEGSVFGSTMTFGVRPYTQVIWPAGEHALVSVRMPRGDPGEAMTMALAADIARAANR